MSARIVTSQTELDQAIADDVAEIIIDSPRGVWLALSKGHVAGVRGQSCVGPVGGSATVSDVGDSATVRDVRDSATVSDVGGSATVRDVRDSATVSDVGDSATVRGVWGSATVSGVWGSATVRGVWGSATVRDVRDSATVSGVGGSATVRDVRDSATVNLFDSANATGVAPFVAVRLHSAKATSDGGVIIDVSKLDLSDPTTWGQYHGSEVADGHMVVFKAVDEDFLAGFTHTLTRYSVGATVEAPDWKPTAACGNGLHFSPSPRQARGYYTGASAPRFLKVRIPLADTVVLDDKAKAKSCVVLAEVDESGDEITAEVAR